MTDQFTIATVGNPNCGKTTLFNALTGARQQVGNWPGVTVERKTGQFRFQGKSFSLVDLPGTYSLDVSDDQVSLDEKVARDFVASMEADLIINIVDASNLERNLYLTIQLLEMQVPMIIALNMVDVAKARDITIDEAKLAVRLGCPVVPIVAASHQGLDQLREQIIRSAEDQHISAVQMQYGETLATAITTLEPELQETAAARGCDGKWLALRLLESDTLAQSMAGPQLVARADRLREEIEDAMDEDIDILTADYRFSFANDIIRETVRKSHQIKRTTSDRIDRVVLNRFVGIPLFFFVMYLMFMFTINIGGALIDFFDMAAGTIFVDGGTYLFSSLGLPEWLTVMLAEGIGGGLQVVATFIPIIGCLYLFLSTLEDSGYMARAAFVMDRLMRFIGLPGKAFVPLIVGFGCNVPAIMATRTMDNARDRILTVMMNPFMSCGARLPVYALFAAAFFPMGGQNMVFGLYFIGIMVAVMTGLIMKKTLFQGATSPFIMELPAYHMPTFRGVGIRTWERLNGFIVRAGRLIVPMVLVLNFLNALGTDGSFNNQDSNRSVLSEIGRTMSPAFAPMGLHEENWPATVGIFTGVLAKEAVVGTLDALYSQMAENNNGSAGAVATEEDSGYDMWLGLSEALATIPENLAGVASMLLDPLGLDIGDIEDASAAAAQQEVQIDTFAAMRASFDGQAGAFAYCLFVLLYFPCVAATAAVHRETSTGWTIFVALWTTGLAYLFATVFYQLARFELHPLSSTLWAGGLVLVFVLTIVALKWWGSRQPKFAATAISGVADRN